MIILWKEKEIFTNATTCLGKTILSVTGKDQCDTINLFTPNALYLNALAAYKNEKLNVQKIQLFFGKYMYTKIILFNTLNYIAFTVYFRELDQPKSIYCEKKRRLYFLG